MLLYPVEHIVCIQEEYLVRSGDSEYRMPLSYDRTQIQYMWTHFTMRSLEKRFYHVAVSC